MESRSQAEDRVHRYGQDRTVVYHDLVASSIDKKVIAALARKKNLAITVLDVVRNKEGLD